MKKVNEFSRMFIKLMDNTIINCQVKDWTDKGDIHIVDKEDQQILFYKHQIAKITFEKIEEVKK